MISFFEYLIFLPADMSLYDTLYLLSLFSLLANSLQLFLEITTPYRLFTICQRAEKKITPHY